MKFKKGDIIKVISNIKYYNINIELQYIIVGTEPNNIWVKIKENKKTSQKYYFTTIHNIELDINYYRELKIKKIKNRIK